MPRRKKFTTVQSVCFLGEKWHQGFHARFVHLDSAVPSRVITAPRPDPGIG